MKTITWLLATVAAFLASETNAAGVVYDPGHVPHADVRADLALIKASGFTHVRTYYSSFRNTNIGAVANEFGLRMALGVTFPFYGTEDLATALDAVKNGNVDYILIGHDAFPSENLPAVIKDVRTKAGATKVGTVVSAEYLRSPTLQVRSLVEACDVLGVAINPFVWTRDRGDAIEETNRLWDYAVNSGIPGIKDKLLLAEAGWPSAGSSPGSGGSIGTPAGLQEYYRAYLNWSSFLPDDKKYYDRFFDTPNHGLLDDSSYGLVSPNGIPKFSFNATSTTTPAPTTPSPPAPTTPASGIQCGNNALGPQPCPNGEYCQPWDPNFYQCRKVPATCGIQEVGIDFNGDDLATFQLLLPEQCCDKCATTAGCKAYTFVNYNADGKAYCYLKKGTGQKTKKAGVVSASIVATCATPAMGSCRNGAAGYSCCPSGQYCQPWNDQYYQCLPASPKCSQQFPNTDFNGDDLATVYGVGQGECCEKCAATAGCKAYTYVHNNRVNKVVTPACYLKKGTGLVQTSGLVVSGLVN